MAFISIALATYNGERFIREQLDSILNQTHQNFEVIICDDCSSDKTWQILEEYSQKDSRIKIFRNEVNLGFKKNFEKIISLCSAEYIALSDQDDVWTDNHLEILYENISNNLLSCGDSIFINESGEFFPNKRKISDNHYDLSRVKDNISVLKRILFRGNIAQGASMLLHRDLLKYVLPIPDCFRFHDSFFALVASSLNRFVYTFTIVNKYRQHTDTVTQNEISKTLFEKCLHLPRYNVKGNRMLPCCKKLLEIVQSNAQKENIELIKFAIYIFSHINNRLFRWKVYKNYKKIIEEVYAGTSTLNIFFRKIQFLFF